MPTRPEILDELAERYGGCNAESPDDIARFYGGAFQRLPRRKRDRISFEILHRDGSGSFEGRLTDAEIRHIDSLFDADDLQTDSLDAHRASDSIRRLALSQAGFSAAVFGVLGSLRLVPEFIPSLGHQILVIADIALITIGVLANGGAFLYERKLAEKRSTRAG